ncbi:hypothetical protein RYX36_005794 [Vicia faba]
MSNAGRYIEKNNGRTLPLSSCNTSLTYFYPSNAPQDSEGYAIGYRNSLRPTLHNQKNLRYSPYGETSNHNNNSLLLNEFNSCSRIGLKDFAIPNANSPPIHPIETKDLNLFYSSSMEPRMFDIRETHAWKKSMTQNKELLLFKDDKNIIPEIKKDDANENDDEHLDLSLHL